MGYGILVAMETKKKKKKKKKKKDLDFKSGRRLNEMSYFCYFVSTKLFLC